METALLSYPLSEGYLHHWLVAGPLEIPYRELAPEFRDSLQVTEPPVDLGGLGSVTQKHPLVTWRYQPCREDHWIDFSTFYPAPTRLFAWAYAQIYSAGSQEGTFQLSDYGAAQAWLNGIMVNELEGGSEAALRMARFPVQLKQGQNELLLRLEGVGVRATTFAAALQISGFQDVEICLPVNIQPEYLQLRQDLETIAEQAWLDRYVYGYLSGDLYNKNEPVVLRFPETLPVEDEITYRIQNLNGNIFLEGTEKAAPGVEMKLARTFPLRNGLHYLALLPPPDLFYIHNVRFERKRLFYVVRTPYSQKAAEDFPLRAKEALEDAAERRSESIYTEIARMSLGRWEKIDRQVMQRKLAGIRQRLDGSIYDMLGLLGMLARFGRRKAFPKDFKRDIQEHITGYRFWEDQPGEDGMDFQSEDRQLLFHTCEALAGQMFPKQVFQNTSKTGCWHKEHGEEMAVSWLRQRGMFGFQEWNSPNMLEAVIAALSHLLELAESDFLAELATVLLDKIMFSLAVHSFKGAYGGSRGKCDTASVLSARLEPTSGIARLMWGLGNHNEALMGRVSLALNTSYELPPLFSQIAHSSASALWSREQQTVPDGSWSVNTVYYRTSDYLLSSAQDYRPGQKGSQEHIWQATLGADALVFVNHPTCFSEEDARQPNLWRGNGVLPRVAQWGDVLIAIHCLPEEDWSGFTHAYFPTTAFDEYYFENGWAFARKGDGFLAIQAAAGFTFIKHGQTAFRELRSKGNQNVWVCHMGHALLDQDFDTFRQKVLGMKIEYSPLAVRLHSLRGDDLEFGWQGSLLVNNTAQPLSGFQHLENPYCTVGFPAVRVDITNQGEGIRLKFD